MKKTDLSVSQLLKMVSLMGGADKALDFLNREYILAPAPLEYKMDNHGFYSVQIVGQGLTGAQEKESGTGASMLGEILLHSAGESSYDANHRLAKGQMCNIVIYKSDGEQTYEEIAQKAARLGYVKVKAESIVRLCDEISGYQLGLMGITKIVGAHDPILTDINEVVLTMLNTHQKKNYISAQIVDHFHGAIPTWTALAFLDLDK